MKDETWLDSAAEYSIAIVGMSGRFPGAADLDEYWKLLSEGREGISFFSSDELEVPVAEADDAPRDVPAKGILEEVEYFDAPFFNIPAREACWMDPQQRIFLECCWWALEDAGYDVERYRNAISVYAGVNFNTYLLARIDQLRLTGGPDLFQVMLTNEKDYLATRVAYKLDLRGESISVQTSCSTSLVAVHMACQSLLGGQSDLAIAGGVSIRLPQKAGYRYQEGLVSSPDGHCRAFDEKAQGTVPGNGVGVVVLKPLPEALDDGDNIYAIIRGSAINNDGNAKAGFTAPSVTGQAEVIAKAVAMADVDPETIGFVEAHGTGTPLGDPIEVEALTRVFRRQTERKGYCALGSVKSNIGHLDAAAGVAGLIKAVLALKHRAIPPTVHFQRPNPALRLEESPFYVNDTLRPWRSAPDHPRRCGVSSFGIGGTNVHMVLEEVPVRPTPSETESPHLFTLSARTASALQSMAARLRAHLEDRPPQRLSDIAYTLNTGRKQFPLRRAVVAADEDELIGKLESLDAAAVAPPDGSRKVAFMFAGQGSQTLGMAEGLLRESALFRRHFERCAEILQDSHRFDLMQAVYPASRGEEDERRLRQPRRALPALFALEYSLAKMWSDLGVEPDGLIGHSFGEYVAASVAGVFSLADGLCLAVERGKLMEKLPPGAMVAVRAPEEELQAYLTEEIELAALNGDAASVLSGPSQEIERVEEELRAASLATRRLPVPFAYHSRTVESIAVDCRRLMAEVELRAPEVPFVSNYTGDWITADDATDPDYWIRQMRHTVRFYAGLEAMREQGFGVFLEIGPGRTLAPSANRLLRGGDRDGVLWSLPGSRPRVTDREAVLDAVGRLWALGQSIDWEKLHEGRARRRVPLPGYPFERRRYWIDLGEPPTAASPTTEAPEEATDTSPVSAAAADVGGHRVRRSEMEIAYAAPQDDLEREVIEAWEDVLGVEGIGRDDSFLDLGGDSLLGTQVYSRLAKIFPAGLELQDVLVEETPAALAAKIREAQEKLKDSPQRPPKVEVPIERIEREGDLPLSYTQEWLWSVDQALAGSPAYNLPYAARVRGDLRADALSAALTEITTRHEVLRAYFPQVDDRPVQRIAAAGEVDLPVTDLDDLPGSQREERLSELLAEEARRPFDLATGPLFRARLLRLGRDDHVVMVTMHHIVSDAWSMGIFAHELSLLYPAFRRGEPSPLPDLPIQYGDFAAWQRDRIGGAEMESLISYWKRQLAGAPQVLELPTDRPGPDRRSGAGARLSFAFSEEVSGKLKELARTEKVTPFMVLLSGFSALLHRQSGQRQMLIGIPVAGRTRPETEGLIGCFINTLAIRVDHSGNPRFDTLLEKVRETTLEAYAHQEVPFERVVRALRPQRDTDHSPLVQALFNFQNIPPRPSLRIPGLDIEPLGADLATAKMDLVVDIWEREEGLAGSVEFNTDLFERSSIDRLMRSFETLLAHAARSPQSRIDSLEVVAEAEKRENVRRRRRELAREKRRFERIQPKPIPMPESEQ